MANNQTQREHFDQAPREYGYDDEEKELAAVALMLVVEPIHGTSRTTFGAEPWL